MALLKLENIRKVFPNERNNKKKEQKDEQIENSSNLQVTKDGVVAVQDFSIEIKDKEFIVLVGPSGCGKTTTLRMIAGLEEISNGDLYLDSKWLNNVPARERDMAMVFQSYALYPHMTVAQNIGFPLKIAKVDKNVIDKRVKEVAKTLEVADLLDRKPKALSGGQRQRVAIARAIVREPKVLLMDEPLSNLDAKLRSQMRAEIIKLRSKIDTTFVYVTHDQTEAMTLGDRIVVMKDGYIQQIGTPTEVFSHPANMFVAEFIGSPKMNIINNCELKKDNNKYYLSLFGSEIALSNEQNIQLNNKIGNKIVHVGIRPTHIDIAKKDFSAKVSVIEMMGSELHVHMSIDSKEIIGIIQNHNDNLPDIKIGDSISFGLNTKLLHLFNSEDGLNIV